ncbi:transposase [Cenarchaeum symbiosum A]|uniref:Transposase n=1 Tax=Cenarchaeum symbiosum (strain A) TaxID=414004 RepID=A0RWK1_CENSY|nr:transposase [Cenarchaeum symbiosum A]
MREITYTGRRKMHGNNTLVVASTSGITQGISMSVGARMVDAGLLEKYLPELRTLFPSIFDPKTPKNRRYEIFLDKGFVGAEKHFPGSTVRNPKKRSKYRELTADEERGNLAVSKIRIKVEHRIGRLKRYQSISGKFRDPANEFNKNIRVVAGIENLRVVWKLGLISHLFPAAMAA